jgi:hypothetical protein
MLNKDQGDVFIDEEDVNDEKIIVAKKKVVHKMTEWHRNWQNEFDKKYQEITIGDRRADVCVNDIVLEIQHSQISADEIKSRGDNYKINKKKLVWVIDCNYAIECFDRINDRYLIKFKRDEWKYEHFIGQENVCLNINDKIFKVDPSKIKSNMIDVKQYKIRNDFVKSINENNDVWDIDELSQCILYHNQRGAGCGKTYESIQLLNNDIRFKDKTSFIYLTKMHSAKEVIYNEMKEQHSRGKLSNLEINMINIADKDNEIGELGNQYKITYKNNETGKDCNIVIGTIDSFMLAINKKSLNSSDYFTGIVNAIVDENNKLDICKDGGIRYAQNNIKLNKHCLILIDEAQDLPVRYIDAIERIMSTTYVDTYIIGDKLQSIANDENIHTYLEHKNLPNYPSIDIIKNIGSNVVRRFHNIQFIDFVNNAIDFNRYNLPCVESICCDVNCKYKHENEIIPYKFFQIPKLKNNADEGDNDIIIDKIELFMNEEIEKYNYAPNNFMFIFPILTKNYQANMLESKLQDFWIKKFLDIDYQKNVLEKNNFWKNKLHDNEYHKYVFLHKSEVGQSINLKESEHATRILSIHASKGNGCEVVFLLGISENNLMKFSKSKSTKDKPNLIYDSLLHVALTRQKKSLYVGLEDNNDDINYIFKNYDIDKNENIKPDLRDITTSNRYQKIIEYGINDDEFINIIKTNNYESIIPKNDVNKNIIDWGHHLIRYYVFLYNFMINITNNETMGEPDKHFRTIVGKLKNKQITSYQYGDYYRKLNMMNKNNMDWKNNNEIPILCFESDDNSKYFKYKNLLKESMENIQQKIKISDRQNKLPILCSLETIMLYYMIGICDDTKYADVSIMDIYTLLYCYDQCSNSLESNHSDKYNCVCSDKFKNPNKDLTIYSEIRRSIVNHHEKTNKIATLYQNYKKYLSQKYANQLFTYNVNKVIKFDCCCNNFKIYNNFDFTAYSKDYIIIFNIVPQLNKLNFNSTIIEGFFNTYLTLNGKYDENENYKNKKIITCIFTLDTDKPLFFEFDMNNISDVIKNIIKKYLFNEYTKYNEKIHDLYNYCQTHRNKNTNSIQCIIDELGGLKYLPAYIKNYFVCISKELSDNKKQTNDDLVKNKILQKVQNIDIFNIEINKNLRDEIDLIFKDNTPDDF